MRLTCKICFLVSLITIACASFSLLAADINEGTGSLMGLAPSCGDCNDGGSSCDGPSVNECANPSPDHQGPCSSDCPGTLGRVCQEKSDAGRWCEDGSKSCADSTRPKCVSYIDISGKTAYKCDHEQTETADCGDAYNTCEYKPPPA